MGSRKSFFPQSVKMSQQHNVLVSKCLACKMSGCQNVSRSKCQSVKMLMCQKWDVCKMSGAEMSENQKNNMKRGQTYKLTLRFFEKSEPSKNIQFICTQFTGLSHFGRVPNFENIFCKFFLFLLSLTVLAIRLQQQLGGGAHCNLYFKYLLFGHI